MTEPSVKMIESILCWKIDSIATKPLDSGSVENAQLPVTVCALVSAYHVSEARQHVARVLLHDDHIDSKQMKLKETNDNYRYNSTLIRQIWYTVARQFLMLARTSTALRASAIAHLIAALVVGSLFWDLGLAQADARTRFGVIFFVLDFTAVGGNALVPGIVSY
jgi:hypothetical protein